MDACVLVFVDSSDNTDTSAGTSSSRDILGCAGSRVSKGTVVNAAQNVGVKAVGSFRSGCTRSGTTYGLIWPGGGGGSDGGKLGHGRTV